MGRWCLFFMDAWVGSSLKQVGWLRVWMDHDRVIVAAIGSVFMFVVVIVVIVGIVVTVAVVVIVVVGVSVGRHVTVMVDLHG